MGGKRPGTLVLPQLSSEELNHFFVAVGPRAAAEVADCVRSLLIVSHSRVASLVWVRVVLRFHLSILTLSGQHACATRPLAVRMKFVSVY